MDKRKESFFLCPLVRILKTTFSGLVLRYFPCRQRQEGSDQWYFPCRQCQEGSDQRYFPCGQCQEGSDQRYFLCRQCQDDSDQWYLARGRCLQGSDQWTEESDPLFSCILPLSALSMGLRG